MAVVQVVVGDLDLVVAEVLAMEEVAIPSVVVTSVVAGLPVIGETMKKLFIFLAVMLIALFPKNSFAWSPPASPKPDSAISDQANVLSDSARHRLDKKLSKINASSANEIAVLILPSLDDENIEDVGIATAKSWGVGKSGLDNGVLIILAMKEHKSRIETGKGVEGDLPDLKCNDILANVLRPFMKKGDVEGGLSATIDSISSSIASHKEELASGHKPSSGGGCQVSPDGLNSIDIAVFSVILLAVIGLGLVWRSSVRRKEEQKRERENEDAEADRVQDEIDRAAEMFATRERLRKENERQEQVRKDREQQETSENLTPVVRVPVITRPSTPVRPPPVKTSFSKPTVVASAVAATATTLASIEAARKATREAEEKREAEESRERTRRLFEAQRAEDDRRRRQEEDDNRRRSESSSPSIPSFDWGSGGGGGSGGGDFGGGSFGGGGSSSDW